jgi:hypothetical protein
MSISPLLMLRHRIQGAEFFRASSRTGRHVVCSETHDQRCTIADSPAMPPSSADERSRQSRKRTIMGRHTFGDELKLGERWKRRLLYALRRRHAD